MIKNNRPFFSRHASMLLAGTQCLSCKFKAAGFRLRARRNDAFVKGNEKKKPSYLYPDESPNKIAGLSEELALNLIF